MGYAWCQKYTFSDKGQRGFAWVPVRKPENQQPSVEILFLGAELFLADYSHCPGIENKASAKGAQEDARDAGWHIVCSITFVCMEASACNPHRVGAQFTHTSV